MKKGIVYLLIAALLASCACMPAFARGGNKTFTEDTVVTPPGADAGVPYDSVVVRSGVTVSVIQGKALDIWKSLTVEAGGSVAGPGQLIFRKGATCEGLEICFLNSQDQIAPLPFAFSKLWEVFGGLQALWVNWQDGHWVIKDRLPAEYDGSATQTPGPGVPAAETAADCAGKLHHLGLLQGSGTNPDGSVDYDMDRAPKRVEAMVMLIRLMGKEKEAKSRSWSHPFTDVPKWADNYIGYAYEKGLTSGISATQFGTGEATAAMYVTFVLRAMGYSDGAGGDFSWKDPFSLARSLQALTGDVNTESFLRADMIVFSFRALYGKCKDGCLLYEKLIADGVFTESEFRDAESLR